MDNVIIYDKLEELNEGIESNGEGINTLLSGRVVKSVQRGHFSSSNTKDSISIAHVDATKSIVLGTLSAVYTLSDPDSPSTHNVQMLLNSNGNSIDFSAESRIIYGISWQVVEFY